MTLSKIFGKYSSYSTLLLRLVLAAVLINHGYAKLFGGLEGTAGFFAGVGIPAASVMAVVVAVVEFFGGIAILLGLFARPAALLVAGQFIVLALMRIFPSALQADAFGKMELELFVLASAVVILLAGSGKFSLEPKLFKKELL